MASGAPNASFNRRHCAPWSPGTQLKLSQGFRASKSIEKATRDAELARTLSARFPVRS